MRRWFLAVLALVLLIPSAALSTGSLVVPNNIFSQPTGNLSADKLDANWSAIASYVNAREITSGLLAARPVAGTSGRYYFATDVNGGTLYLDTGAAWVQLAGAVNANIVQQLTGLGLANNGSATATFTVAVGAATSDDTVVANRIVMSLAAGLTKSLAAWAVGAPAGCLDAGAVATFTWYHVFVIERVDTGVVDAVCSTSATAPTMPTNYTKKRRIGSVRTDWTGTGSIYFFTQDGDYFEWATKTTTLDVNNAASGIVAVTATLSVPNGVAVRAVVNAMGNTTEILYLTPLAVTDEAPSGTTTPLGQVGNTTGTNGTVGQVQVLTNTAQQIRYRSSVNGQVSIVTTGYFDRRGQQ